jgi:hypothetical protein
MGEGTWKRGREKMSTGQEPEQIKKPTMTEVKQDATLDIKEAECKDYLAPVTSHLPEDIHEVLTKGQQGAHFCNVSELMESVNNTIDSLDNVLNKLLDQVEEQVLPLKTSIIAIDHMLPEDTLQNSKVILMNTSKQEFLNAFSDEAVMENTTIGKNIRASHIFANLASVNGIHGAFVMFPMGSADAMEADQHYNALINLGKLAHRNMFHVYFQVDIPRIAFQSKDGHVYPLEKPSSLMQGYQDIQEWMNAYRTSSFYRKLTQQANYKLLRRMTSLFNPYLGNTETLESFYREGKQPDEKMSPLLDRVPWVSPVSFMGQQLIQNYEVLGWCGGLFGLRNTARQISDYYNPNPQLRNNGLSFSRDMGYRYGLTLYNYLSDRQGQGLIELGLTPLQRQIKNDEEEWLALAEAQTLLPQPENFNERLSKEEYEHMSKLKQQDFRDKATQKMYSYLGNCLMEDTISRGIILLCKKFIGTVGAKQATVDNLREAVKDYLSIFAGHPGLRETAPYNTYEPALESFEIKEVSMAGSTATVNVKIKPVEALRKVALFVDTDPLDFEVEVDKDKLKK